MRLPTLILASLWGTYAAPQSASHAVLKARDVSQEKADRDENNYRVTASTAATMKVPDGTEPGFFYRGDSRDPDYIFSHGFAPQGTNMDIMQHLSFAGNSGYVSVSRSRPAVRRYIFGRPADGHTTGYLYIVAPFGLPPGYWLPGLYSRDGAVQRNQEFAVAGHIPAEAIAGAFVFENHNPDNPTEWRSNEGYAYQAESPFDPGQSCLGRICRYIAQSAQWICSGMPDPCIARQNEAFDTASVETPQVDQPPIVQQPVSHDNEACEVEGEDGGCNSASKANSADNPYVNRVNTGLLVTTCLWSLKNNRFKRAAQDYSASTESGSASTEEISTESNKPNECPLIVDAWAYPLGLKCIYGIETTRCFFSARNHAVEDQMVTKLKVRAKVADDWYAGSAGPIAINFGTVKGTVLFKECDRGDTAEVGIDMERVFGAQQVPLRDLQHVEIYHELYQGYWSAFLGKDMFKIQSLVFEIEHVKSGLKLINDRYSNLNMWMGNKSRVWPTLAWGASLYEDWHVDLS